MIIKSLQKITLYFSVMSVSNTLSGAKPSPDLIDLW